MLVMTTTHGIQTQLRGAAYRELDTPMSDLSAFYDGSQSREPYGNGSASVTVRLVCADGTLRPEIRAETAGLAEAILHLAQFGMNATKLSWACELNLNRPTGSETPLQLITDNSVS